MSRSDARDAGSFRDPSGFVFWRDGRPYRQVNQSYAEDYDRLLGSGLYEELVAAKQLVAHEEVDVEPADDGVEVHRILAPELVPFISYPYEWSFSQLQDAALLTLDLQRKALAKDLSLKDANGYNVQFLAGRPVFIDTLSFERYEEGKPWAAYGQFCRQFLAPLALMSYVDVRLGQLLRVHLDGIPLDLCCALLPWKTRLRPSLAAHLHLHAASERRYADAPQGGTQRKLKVKKTALLGIVDSLTSLVKGLSWKAAGTEWAGYYERTNYSDGAMQSKRTHVGRFCAGLPEGARVWDLGANDGTFSRLATERASLVVSLDVDPAAVEANYLRLKADGEGRMLPLLCDLTHPSAAGGWALRERASLLGRGPADALLALALIHHLAIGNNVPLPQVAELMADIAEHALVEFVPKSDSQVARMLSSREDIFPDYTAEGFERSFGARFEVRERLPVEGSERTLYWLRRKAT